MNRTSDEYEKIYWSQNKYVMGIDEAGRGPLCGPLVVACCVLPINYENPNIYDSKQLSEKKRKLMFQTIIKDAIYFKIAIVEPDVIDKDNIYQATRNAMTNLALSYDNDVVLTDAMPLEINKESIAIVKGDQKSINIASASILAKVVRDHIMMGYHHLYPEYQFNKHKGYPTKLHLELLKQYGLKDFYRMSYGPCKKLNEIKLF